MSKLAVHIAHYKKGAVGSIAGHNWYKRGEHDQHSNQDIDQTRSKDNIALILPEEGSFYQSVKASVEASTGRVTSASVWVSEWCIYPPEQLQDPFTADKAEVERYFRDVADWMKDNGYDVRLAIVHMDESTVHGHFDTVPITKDGRLSRKDIYTRAALNSIHTDLAKYLASKGWDIQRGESTKDKQVKSVSVPEYKKQAEAEKISLVAEIRQDEKRAQDARQEVQRQLDKVQEVKDQVKELEPPESVQEVKPVNFLGVSFVSSRSMDNVMSYARSSSAARQLEEEVRNELEMTKKENERLQRENAELRERVRKSVDFTIKSIEKDRQITMLQKQLDQMREFLRSVNLIQKFEQWLKQQSKDKSITR